MTNDVSINLGHLMLCWYEEYRHNDISLIRNANQARRALVAAWPDQKKPIPQIEGAMFLEQAHRAIEYVKADRIREIQNGVPSGMSWVQGILDMMNKLKDYTPMEFPR